MNSCYTYYLCSSELQILLVKVLEVGWSSNRRMRFDYGIDRQRVMQTFSDGTTTRTKRYFTPLYETVTENGVTKKLHYLTSSTGLFAIFASYNNGGGTMHYTLKDHQGNLTATISGNTVERLSYDAWGRRRNPVGFGYATVAEPVEATFDRGYTLHEHYDEFDLINMNGRLYDPVLGRMLSPDIAIQDLYNQQAYNRYSYCLNNPLRFTDPSGYFVSGTSSQFRSFTLLFYENNNNKGVYFSTDEALGLQIPKIEFAGKDEEEEYNKYRDEVFSHDTEEYKAIQAELIRLENAEEVFRIRMKKNINSKAGGGNFIYNKKTGEFDVNIADYGDFSTMGKIAHELKHADQYMKKELGFDLQTGKILAYDINDEIEAFNRQGMFGKTLTENEVRNDSRYNYLPNMKSNLTIDNLQNMHPSLPFNDMIIQNKLYQEFNKVRFLYHGWQNDIK